MVDDYPDATDTDYVNWHTNTTSGNALKLGFAPFAIPVGATGITVYVDTYARAVAASNCNIIEGLGVGGNIYSGTTHTTNSTSYTAFSSTWANNPKTGAPWTVDDINGIGANALAYFGFYSSDASPDVWIASCQIRVTWS